MFSYSRTVHFYETDSMKVVHHANYVKYLEETRIAWAQSKGFMSYQKPEGANQFAVIDCHLKYLKPAYFGEKLLIELQAKIEGIRLIFEYKIFSLDRNRALLTEGRTMHAHVDDKMQLRRPSDELIRATEKEKWTETWLLNL